MNRIKVCMFVYNNCTTDARVLKEARTLVDSGYDVRIVALLDNKTAREENRDGIRILRVQRVSVLTKLSKPLSRVKNIFTGKPNPSSVKPTREVPARRGDMVQPESPKRGMLATFLTRFSALGPTRFLGHFYKKHPLIGILFFWIVIPSVYGFHLMYPRLMLIHRESCFKSFGEFALELIKKEPADIYHGHDFHTLPIAFAAARRTDAKVVYDSHELYTEMSGLSKSAKKKYTALERKYIGKVDHVITVNQSIASELKQRYEITEPSVIMNCPPASPGLLEKPNDLLREKLNIDKGTPIVLYQGGFAPDRGLENLIKAAAGMQKGVVVFMGWGKIEEELKALVQELSLGEKVLFTAGVPQAELLDHTKSADVGVIPYQFVGLNNYYTSPNKLFEYMNAGVPVAGSNFPELVRVIEGENIGATFDPEKPDDIARAINELLGDTVELKNKSERAFEAAKKYNWEIEGAKLVDIYRELSRGINPN